MDRNTGEKALRDRIKSGKVSRADVTRRLAELAFGKANDCVRLALEDDPKLGRLDLSLLSEVKRNDKGTVEIKLIDRLRALEQLAQVAEESGGDLEGFDREENHFQPGQIIAPGLHALIVLHSSHLLPTSDPEVFSSLRQTLLL